MIVPAWKGAPVGLAMWLAMVARAGLFRRRIRRWMHRTVVRNCDGGVLPDGGIHVHILGFPPVLVISEDGDFKE